MDDALTREEDAELRRLAALAAYGELSEQAAALYDDLRGRDRRRSVREPVDIVLPRPRPTRADGPMATSGSSAAQ